MPFPFTEILFFAIVVMNDTPSGCLSSGRTRGGWSAGQRLRKVFCKPRGFLRNHRPENMQNPLENKYFCKVGQGSCFLFTVFCLKNNSKQFPPRAPHTRDAPGFSPLCAFGF